MRRATTSRSATGAPSRVPGRGGPDSRAAAAKREFAAARAKAKAAAEGQAGTGGGISASQQMIQTINVLYEVADSSAEHGRGGSGRGSVDSTRRDHDIQVLSLALLADPRFVTDRQWLAAASEAVMGELLRRLCERVLQRLVVDWSAATARALPAYLVEPRALELGPDRQPHLQERGR